MPRTIPDEEYQFLQGKRQIADFVESIYNSPQWNKEAKRLIKRAYPQIQIPDLDIEERVEERLAQDRKERQDIEDAKRQEADKASWDSLRERTKTQYGLTDEGMEKLEKMMVERNVGDYDVAASYMVAKDPKPSEAQFDAVRWNYDKAPGFAEIAKDPEGWGRAEILKAIRTDQERARGR